MLLVIKKLDADLVGIFVSKCFSDDISHVYLFLDWNNLVAGNGYYQKLRKIKAIKRIINFRRKNIKYELGSVTISKNYVAPKSDITNQHIYSGRCCCDECI